MGSNKSFPYEPDLFGILRRSCGLLTNILFVRIAPHHHVSSDHVDDDRDGPRALIPHVVVDALLQYECQVPDRALVRINALGLRGPEVAPKRPGVFRVLVFGDSYAFGVGVDEENVLTSELERLLSEDALSGVEVEVLNLGVAGYSLGKRM